MEGVQMSDTIILDSKKCNAELLTIHADGRITVAEHLKPTETAAAVLQIMREQWLADIQSIKIRDQQERIKRLEAGDAALTYSIGLDLQKENDALKDRIKRLEEALNGTVNWIVKTANSGDAGFWDAEEVSEIIAARAALKIKEAKP
jgi:hypothetical protein